MIRYSNVVKVPLTLSKIGPEGISLENTIHVRIMYIHTRSLVFIFDIPRANNDRLELVSVLIFL